MRKTLIGLAISAFSMTVSAGVDACSYTPGNRAYQPVMADYVRNAPAIYWARAISAENTAHPGSFDHPDRFPTWRYEFEVMEVLKGEVVDRFPLMGFRPFTEEMPDECLSDDADISPRSLCGTARDNAARYQRAHEAADSGHTGWDRFTYLPPVGFSGMGQMQTYEPDRVSVGGCGQRSASYEIGETFLIMYGGETSLFDAQAINNHLVTQGDDVWLEAVRFLVARPDAERLPARTLSDILAPHGEPMIVEAAQCMGGSGYTIFNVEMTGVTGTSGRLIYEQAEEGGAGHIAHCESGGEFLGFDGALNARESNHYSVLPLFPIRDGMVDFSDLASQWEISGSRHVLLADVLAWSSNNIDAE